MAMSSFLINSNYVDPKFPPCEEYSQSDYLPSHSAEYYGGQRPPEDAFEQRRAACAEQPRGPGGARPASPGPPALYPWMKKVHVGTGKSGPGRLPPRAAPRRLGGSSW
ncbi:hypothetical protein DV515_00018835 [Chloebia gouldiae]|uniref:Homeobox domain-containing protein n=1 Tax=Chloebia gouldiae TaxID=44316 RepID=A0A3L8Q6F7_CHLGU|nr:hypothetical protein DV515_00018835 [Chloebia gouldiae]